MSQKTLEKVLEHLLNHEQEAAGDLLHNYFVEKGRGIYESMIQADEQIEEEIGGDPVASFEEEVSANEEEIENEEMFSEGDEAAHLERAWELNLFMNMGNGYWVGRMLHDDGDSRKSTYKLYHTDDAKAAANPKSNQLSNVWQSIGFLNVSAYRTTPEEIKTAAMKLIKSKGTNTNEGFKNTYEGDEAASEKMPMDDMPADDMGGEEGEESAASSVEDAMMDVEDAISALKAEFEKLVDGEAGEEAGEDHEAAADDAGEEIGESVDLKKVSVTHSDNGDAGAKNSPMSASFKKFDTGAEPAKFSGGADEKGGKAGAPKQNPASPGTTEPRVKPAPKPATADGSDKSSKSPIAGK